MITGTILKLICPKLNTERADKLADYLDKICPQYGIDTPDIFHEFLANLAHECREFTKYEENLNYTAKRMTEVWKTRFPTLDAALPYEKNPAKLAEKVYGGRKDLGNVQPGDGFMFRGSGPIQMTGRYNFTAFAAYMRSKFNLQKTLAEWADLLRTNDEYAIHSACWIFAISKKLIDEALADNMKEIVRKINGGFTGMQDRDRYYQLCKKYVL